MKQNAMKPGAKQAPSKSPSTAMYNEHKPESDLDDAPLNRQLPGFTPPNSCDETQGPGVRSIQDYKK